MAASGGVLALAAPVAAKSSRLEAKLYLPSALKHDQLPAGLGSMTTVPRLSQDEAESWQERLQEYVRAIRATAPTATCTAAP